MGRVELTAEDAAFIAARIAAYDLETTASDIETGLQLICWSRYVAAFAVLPLYHGWTESIGIRADGTLVSWSSEGEYEGTKTVDEPIWFRIALVQGAKQYPTLRNYIPSRSANAVTCETCHGTGTIQRFPTVICQCGGVGWVDEHTPK